MVRSVRHSLLRIEVYPNGRKQNTLNHNGRFLLLERDRTSERCQNKNCRHKILHHSASGNRHVFLARLSDVHRWKQRHLPTKAIYQCPAKGQIVFGNSASLAQGGRCGVEPLWTGCAGRWCRQPPKNVLSGTTETAKPMATCLLQERWKCLGANQRARHEKKCKLKIRSGWIKFGLSVVFVSWIHANAYPCLRGH